MDISLENKRAVVAGGTAGIGRATAEELARNGADVTLIARNEEKLKEVIAILPNSNQDHNYLVCDFNDPSHLEEVLQGYLEEEYQVQILINNTGGPPGGKANEASLEEFRVAFNQHLICNQILAKAFVPSMRESQYGRIINVISTSVKAPIPGLGVSNTIRGAVANWAKTLSVELGPSNITVNNVLPGATMTGRLESIIQRKALNLGISEDMVKNEMMKEIPLHRFAEASEVADVISFLASPAASYINGINIPVDGGRLPNL